MVTVLALLGVVLVLFVAAVVATRDGAVMADAPQDLPDLALPEGPLRAHDIARLRFSMAPRGYRMSEVDAVLDRLATELAERDRRLEQLGAEDHLPQDHLPQDHLPQDRLTQDRLVEDARLAEGRAADGRGAEDRVVSRRVAEGRDASGGDGPR